MKRKLHIALKGSKILEAIEGLSGNEILVLQAVAAEKPSFLDLNATLHHQFEIDNALEIVTKLKNKDLIIELNDYNQ